MPQSHNQTSRRLGGTLLLVEHRRELVSGRRGDLIAQRTGIRRRKMRDNCADEFLFLLHAQGLNSDNNLSTPKLNHGGPDARRDVLRWIHPHAS